ncbi:transposase [Belnapia sp. T18]|uniref:Transposase n=1 Tax=Belnapia arida TaxID=2804533 RepID=A0ABS1U954_9PROT|nr:transposase [Belnapia arida]MBL6081201.1 transposase [Belnapia arida]
MAQTRASTGAGTGAEIVATERVEIVTRGERRRSYTPEDKARLLAETAEPGARVLEVARRHGISPSLLHRWRREAEGRPLRKMTRSLPRLVPLLVEAPGAASSSCTTAATNGAVGATIEVVLRNGRVLRVGAASDVAVVARLAQVLEA